MTSGPCVHEVMRPYTALLDDVWRWAPDLVSSFSDAVSHLEKLVKTRGTRVVLLELPEYGKLFDKSLSTEFLDTSKLPATLGSWNKGTYLLQDILLTQIYESNLGFLQQGISPSLIFLLRTFLYMGKKTEKECPDVAVSQEVSEFFNCDRGLRSPSLNWSGDWLFAGFNGNLRFADPRYVHRRGVESQIPLELGTRDTQPTAALNLLRVFDSVCGILVSKMPEFDPSSMVGRHGPGAVADQKTGGDKYTFAYWPQKCDQLFHYERHALSREDLIFDVAKPVSKNEPPARLLAVPKTFKGPRLITSEPTAHQFLQQGLMKWMRKNLPRPLRAAICFDSQDPSKDAALLASLDGLSATVDLSSASDRLSLWAIERAFRANHSLLAALHATRTRRVVNSTGVGPPQHQAMLRKYAGQGNATTFTVQSMVYAMAAIAAIIYSEKGPKARLSSKMLMSVARRCRVFGDDIVIPSSAGLYLVAILEFLQLKVNWAKTHTRGHFRESCGMDAWNGCEVTPHYMQSLRLPAKPSPEELASWIDVSNNAFHKGLWSLATWMDSCMPDNLRRAIAISRNPVEGLRLATFVNGVISKRTRYNSTLMRHEIHNLVVVTSTVRRRRDTYDSLLQYFVEAPPPDILYTSGWVVRSCSRFRKQWVPAS